MIEDQFHLMLDIHQGFSTFVPRNEIVPRPDFFSSAEKILKKNTLPQTNKIQKKNFLSHVPEKKNPAVFSPNFGSFFVFFSGNFLKYRAISKIFPETSRKNPYRYQKGPLGVFTVKKNEKVLILLFFLLFSRNILWNFFLKART